MKSSIMALLTAATLTFASMGVVYAQDAAVAPGEGSTECMPGAAADATPETMSGASTEATGREPATAIGDDTDEPGDDAANCCIGADGTPTPVGVDADCPAKAEDTPAAQ